jgi:hypothetical protein
VSHGIHQGAEGVCHILRGVLRHHLKSCVNQLKPSLSLETKIVLALVVKWNLLGFGMGIEILEEYDLLQSCVLDDVGI